MDPFTYSPLQSHLLSTSNSCPHHTLPINPGQIKHSLKKRPESIRRTVLTCRPYRSDAISIPITNSLFRTYPLQTSFAIWMRSSKTPLSVTKAEQQYAQGYDRGLQGYSWKYVRIGFRTSGRSIQVFQYTRVLGPQSQRSLKPYAEKPPNLPVQAQGSFSCLVDFNISHPGDGLVDKQLREDHDDNNDALAYLENSDCKRDIQEAEEAQQDPLDKSKLLPKRAKLREIP